MTRIGLIPADKNLRKSVVSAFICVPIFIAHCAQSGMKTNPENGEL